MYCYLNRLFLALIFFKFDSDIVCVCVLSQDGKGLDVVGVVGVVVVSALMMWW